MNSEEFIKKYDKELWNICDNAAKEMFPHIKKLGLRGIDKSYYDDVKTLYNILVMVLQEVIDTHMETFQLATGCYRVVVEEYYNKIGISILYEIQDETLELS